MHFYRLLAILEPLLFSRGKKRKNRHEWNYRYKGIDIDTLIYVLSPWIVIQGCIIFLLAANRYRLVSFHFVFRFVPFSLSLFVTYGAGFFFFFFQLWSFPKRMRERREDWYRITNHIWTFIICSRRSKGGFFFFFFLLEFDIERKWISTIRYTIQLSLSRNYLGMRPERNFTLKIYSPSTFSFRFI